MKANEKTSNDELVSYLNASNEALRMENLRLMSQVERLANHLEVVDAEYVSNNTRGTIYNLTK